MSARLLGLRPRVRRRHWRESSSARIVRAIVRARRAACLGRFQVRHVAGAVEEVATNLRIITDGAIFPTKLVMAVSHWTPQSLLGST